MRAQFSIRFLLPALAAIAAAALAAAYTAQYGFGLLPCILCLYQRIPYAVVVVIGLAGTFAPEAARRPLAWLCAATFAAGAGIAGFHVGVEQHWWQGLETCSGAALDTSSLEALRAQITGSKLPRCDQPAWALFGITMAGYNMAASLFLAAFTLLASLRPAKK